LFSRKQRFPFFHSLNSLAHSSIEFQAILLYCSLDSPILVINLYRHPNIKTSSLFYSNLFAAASAHKFSLILGNFNTHHHAWGDARIDGQGDAILRTTDLHNMVITNDGRHTFISSSGHASSIDLSIASHDLRFLVSNATLQDLHGSDYIPVSVFVAEISPSTFQFSNRIPLTLRQFSALHSKTSYV